jgi:preprotein translocase subunit SecA
MWARSKASRKQPLPKPHWSRDDRDWDDEDDEDDDWDEESWDAGSFNDSRNQAAPGHKLQPIVHTEPRVGRNEQCPCGSGKKYKNCCLRNTPK